MIKPFREGEDDDIGLLEFIGLLILAFGIVVGLWVICVYYIVTFS